MKSENLKNLSHEFHNSPVTSHSSKYSPKHPLLNILMSMLFLKWEIMFTSTKNTDKYIISIFLRFWTTNISCRSVSEDPYYVKQERFNIERDIYLDKQFCP
jgi:hypothetical protein